MRTGSAKQVFDDAITLDKLIDIINDDPVGIKLIILDACRNSPLAEEEGLQAGLANTKSGIRPGPHRVCDRRGGSGL